MVTCTVYQLYTGDLRCIRIAVVYAGVNGAGQQCPSETIGHYQWFVLVDLISLTVLFLILQVLEICALRCDSYIMSVCGLIYYLRL